MQFKGWCDLTNKNITFTSALRTPLFTELRSYTGFVRRVEHYNNRLHAIHAGNVVDTVSDRPHPRHAGMRVATSSGSMRTFGPEFSTDNGFWSTSSGVHILQAHTIKLTHINGTHLKFLFGPRIDEWPMEIMVLAFYRDVHAAFRTNIKTRSRLNEAVNLRNKEKFFRLIHATRCIPNQGLGDETEEQSACGEQEITTNIRRLFKI